MVRTTAFISHSHSHSLTSTAVLPLLLLLLLLLSFYTASPRPATPLLYACVLSMVEVVSRVVQRAGPLVLQSATAFYLLLFAFSLQCHSSFIALVPHLITAVKPALPRLYNLHPQPPPLHLHPI